MPASPRSAGASYYPVLQDEVAVGRGDIDHDPFPSNAVGRLLDAQRYMAPEDAGEEAGDLGRDVDDDEHGRGEVSGNALFGTIQQRIDASRRCTDHNDSLF